MNEENQKLITQAMIWLRTVEFMNYHFFVYEGHGGVFLQAHYLDEDIYTKKIEQQKTRPWRISPETTESELIQTAFKCVATSMEHRTRETFRYKGARIFGPHFDVNDLVRLCKDERREDAGARVQVQQYEKRRIDP